MAVGGDFLQSIASHRPTPTLFGMGGEYSWSVAPNLRVFASGFLESFDNHANDSNEEENGMSLLALAGLRVALQSEPDPTKIHAFAGAAAGLLVPLDHGDNVPVLQGELGLRFPLSGTDALRTEVVYLATSPTDGFLGLSAWLELGV